MGFGSGGFGSGGGSSGGGGGDSLWSEYGDNTVRPDAPATSVTLIENDDNSRDNPKAVVIVRNEGIDGNPEFAIGNPYIAGVGLPALGSWYRDDETGEWLLNFSWEASGTFASVLDGVERSAFESFGEHGQFKPWMRVEMSGRGINFGSSVAAAAGEVSRTAGVVTVGPTVNPHRMAVGDDLWRTQNPYTGEASDLTLFGPESTAGSSYEISEIVDPYTFRYIDAGSNGSSAGGILYSKETDVTFGRDATGVGAVRVNGSTVTQFDEFGIHVPSGLKIFGEDTLYVGADGVATLELTDEMVHVANGKTFYQEGTYRSTGWYNGGGQTQSTQEVFVVGTGSGNKTTTLRVIDDNWIRLMVTNHGEGGANTLTINAGVGNTINGAASLTIPANAGATLVSVETDWRVFYHPAPP